MVVLQPDNQVRPRREYKRGTRTERETGRLRIRVLIRQRWPPINLYSAISVVIQGRYVFLWKGPAT